MESISIVRSATLNYRGLAHLYLLDPFPEINCFKICGQLSYFLVVERFDRQARRADIQPVHFHDRFEAGDHRMKTVVRSAGVPEFLYLVLNHPLIKMNAANN